MPSGSLDTGAHHFFHADRFHHRHRALRSRCGPPLETLPLSLGGRAVSGLDLHGARAGEKGNDTLAYDVVGDSPLYPHGYDFESDDWVFSSMLSVDGEALYDMGAAFALGPGDSIHAFLAESESSLSLAATSEWESSSEYEGRYMVGLSSDDQTLVAGAVALSDASMDGASWRLDDATFQITVDNSSLVDGVADARASVWVTSLDAGLKFEVADAYFGVQDASSEDGDVWVEVGPIDGFVQVENHYGSVLSFDLDYDSSSVVSGDVSVGVDSVGFELATSDDDTLVEADVGASVWLGGTETGFKVEITDAYLNSTWVDLGKLDLIADATTSPSVALDLDYARGHVPRRSWRARRARARSRTTWWATRRCTRTATTLRVTTWSSRRRSRSAARPCTTWARRWRRARATRSTRS